MSDGFPTQSNESELDEHHLRLVGGTTACTKVMGMGMAVAWVSTGLYEITWAIAPGSFAGLDTGLQATTPADIAGHTIVAGVYNATTRKLRFSLYNASFSLHDLAALEWINLTTRFKQIPLGT